MAMPVEKFSNKKNGFIEIGDLLQDTQILNWINK